MVTRQSSVAEWCWVIQPVRLAWCRTGHGIAWEPGLLKEKTRFFGPHMPNSHINIPDLTCFPWFSIVFHCFPFICHMPNIDLSCFLWYGLIWEILLTSSNYEVLSDMANLGYQHPNNRNVDPYEPQMLNQCCGGNRGIPQDSRPQIAKSPE